MYRFLIVLQVEREVCSLLAFTQDHGLIGPGCSPHLSVIHCKGRGGKSLGDAARSLTLRNWRIKREKVKLISIVKQLKFPHLSIYYAYAQDHGLISPGSSPHLSVDYPKGRGVKSLGDAAPTIKLTNLSIKREKVKLISIVN